MTGTDPGAVAHGIMDDILYMVLATADEGGRPWVSPVYFAHSDYTELFWVSSPEATHSRNIAVRPAVSIVVFDSTVPVGSGQGVYMAAGAGEVPGGGLRALDPRQGRRPRPPGRGRLPLRSGQRSSIARSAASTYRQGRRRL